MPGVKFSQFQKGGAGKFGDQVVGLRNGLNTIFDSMPSSGTFSLVNKAGHGFTVGQVVYHDGTEYKLALATFDDAEVIGCVSIVIDADNFQMITHGLLSGLENLVPGTTYFLSDTVPGLLTDIEPTTVGNISKPLLIATKEDEALFNNFRGKIIPALIPPPNNLQTDIHQVAHGFAAKDIVRLSGVNFVKAQADTIDNAEVVGMVSHVLDVDNFTLITSGFVTIQGPTLETFTAGTTYYLSDVQAGYLSAIEPVLPGSISKPLFLAVSSYTGYLFNFRGKINPDDLPVSILAQRITQVAHGFTVGQALYFNGGQYQPALADTVNHAESLGVVSKILDVNSFTLTLSGLMTSVNPAFTNFIPGATYFLSDNTPGRLSLVEPTLPGSVSKPMFFATSPTEGYVINMRGRIIPEPPFDYVGVNANLSINQNMGYVTLDPNNRMQLTLPTTARFGSVIEVLGFGAGGWQLNQNANQIIHFLGLNTTPGLAGYIASTQGRNTVKLVCVVADTEWLVSSSVGNITII